jgi:hypothetical protein
MELEITPEDVLIFTHNQPFAKKVTMDKIYVVSMLNNIRNGLDENSFSANENKEFARLIRAYKEIWVAGADLTHIQHEFFPNCIMCSDKSSGLWGLRCGLTIPVCHKHSCEWAAIREQHTKLIEGNWFDNEVNAEISRDTAKTLLKRNGIVILGVNDGGTINKKTYYKPNIIKSYDGIEDVDCVPKKEIYSNYNCVHEQFIQCALNELNRPYFRKWN